MASAVQAASRAANSDAAAQQAAAMALVLGGGGASDANEGNVGGIMQSLSPIDDGSDQVRVESRNNSMEEKVHSYDF